MRRTFFLVLVCFSAAGGVVPVAWAAPAEWTPGKAASREKLPQTKTQWQEMAENDVSAKNSRWDMIDEQFQPGKPPAKTD